MKTYRKTLMAATAALGGLVLLAAVATAHGPGGPGQNAGAGNPYMNGPGSMMGAGARHGGVMGPGYGGMMGPGYGGTMGPSGPDMTAPGATHAPQMPCNGLGAPNVGPCGNGNLGAYPSPNRETLPSWR